MKLKTNKVTLENTQVTALDLFAHLTHNGSVPGCSYFEINDQASPYYGFIIGVCKSSLAIQGKGENFCYQALSEQGQLLLTSLKNQLDFCENLTIGKEKIFGQLTPELNHEEFEVRLAAINHRQLIEKLIPDTEDDQALPIPLSIFGCFAFDFIKQTEQLPTTTTTTDSLNDPDYCFYLPENLFVYQPKNQLLTLLQLDDEENFCNDFFKNCQLLLKQNYIYPNYSCKNFSCDLNHHEYQEKFYAIKDEILAGNVFQLVFGSGFQGDFTGSPLAVLKKLKAINPSDFIFYFRDEQGALLGCSPENCLRIKQQNQERIVELTPLAGTMPRSQQAELDQRLKINLLTNQKELAEHSMLIDLARNDLCSIAETGSVHVSEAYQIKSYQSVQHLASRVSAKLRSDLTPIQAYQATMNMGTLSGSPKPRALDLIAKYENQSRGYFGGAFAMISKDCMESCIIIRSLRVKNNKVYLRAASGIVLDSQLDTEWNEINLKAASCIQSLNEENFL